jgi:hypothetical protein
MKKFLRNLLLISLPCVAGAVALLWMPLPRKWAYNYAAKDCRNAVWIPHRLYEDPRPIDVAFLGSSRTFCAVDDGELDNLLSAAGAPVHVANLSLCRFGRDGQLAVLEDLLRTKSPQWIIIEVNEREPFSTHLSYPALAAPGQLAKPMSPLNRDYFKNMALGLQVRHRYVQERIFQNTIDTIGDPQQQGFYHIHGFEHISEAQAAEFNAQAKPPGTPGGTVKQRMAWEYKASEAFLGEMVARCKAAGAQVAFLYLPSYTNRAALPAEMELYKSLGAVWTPPMEIWNDPLWWRDVNHLNERGTSKLSLWLKQQLSSQPPTVR